MATTHRTILFAAALVLLLSINTADAMHPFRYRPRYTTDVSDSNAIPATLSPRIKSIRHRDGSKSRRVPRHSGNHHHLSSDDQQIPASLMEQLRTPVQNELRERYPKRNNNQESAPYIYKDAYLSLCHFKICNMGRKRSARSIQLNARQHPHLRH